MTKKTPKLPKPHKAAESDTPLPKVKRTGKSSNPAPLPNEISTQPLPKPRNLVAPVSWTGKLPVTLLHEHCQKLGWSKVNYGMASSRLLYLSNITEKR